MFEADVNNGKKLMAWHYSQSDVMDSWTMRAGCSGSLKKPFNLEIERGVQTLKSRLKSAPSLLLL